MKYCRKEHIPRGGVQVIPMSEDKNPKMFKTVFGGGYQKSDVNEYIESMLAQFQSIEQTLKNTINHQRAELDGMRAMADGAAEARETAEELRMKLEAAETDLKNVREELQTAREEADRFKTDCIAAEATRATAEAAAAAGKDTIAALTEERDAANTALSQLRTQYDALLSECQTQKEAASASEPIPEPIAAEPSLPADYEALKLKAEQYDRMSAHIGAIMLKANAGAEDVMKSARADADAMIARVNNMLNETKVRAENSADHLIEDISRSLSEISRECKDEISLDLEELRAALRTLESAAAGKYADINRKLDYAKDEMEQTAGAIIRAATTPVSFPTDL